jgi:hypothetical protein
MDFEYSVDVVNKIEDVFKDAQLHRPMRVSRYDAGTELHYDVTGVAQAYKARVHLIIDKFVGGGFAGQVYKVRILDIDSQSGPMQGLDAGKSYAMKILVPPSNFSRLFRNGLYWLGFQGPFQPQVNPAAARAGALWQKFIRRGAKIKFGDDSTVVDIHAIFVDERIGSCGELSEWIDGRTWRLEVDERMDLLRRWIRGKKVDSAELASPEYRDKHEFMHKFVELLHDMGGHEFARQYEWSTCKSQPNCLKRSNSESAPYKGLVAVDFRAGLALLPFLPMSPGDIKLIAKGLTRGSLVQFDKGDILKLEQFINKNKNEFADMGQMLEELKALDRVYRESLPDITHNHFRLLYKRRLWATIFKSAVTGYKVRNLIDTPCEKKLNESKSLTFLFFLMGIVPFLGPFLRKVWCRDDWRRHYKKMLTSWDYFCRAVRGKFAEETIGWYRAGRIDGRKALMLIQKTGKLFYHWPLSFLPVGLHRFFTDPQCIKNIFFQIAVRPIRLYFNADLREQWLQDMVTQGEKKQLLTNEDAATILSQIKEPFIQKYLKSLAVHILCMPVTHVVAAIVAAVFWIKHPEMSTQARSLAAAAILAAFQLIPISPGSIVRGLYVLYLVIKERNFKDYNIALFLAFFKYIGYLAFPIQMGYRYPALARFIAAHWATEAVHIVPVFGEKGALLEHGIFSLFYNWPLTIRRRMAKRSQMRATMQPRRWHTVLAGITGLGIFILADHFYFLNNGVLPGLKNTWMLAIFVSMICGSVISLGAAGATFSNRIIGAALCAVIIGIAYTTLSGIAYGSNTGFSAMIISGLWRIFISTIFTVMGAILTEIMLPEPEMDNDKR